MHIRFLAEAIGLSVDWDEKTRTAYIGDESNLEDDNMVRADYKNLGFSIYLPKGYEKQILLKVEGKN